MSSSAAALPPLTAAAPAAGGCGGKGLYFSVHHGSKNPCARQVHLSLADTEAT